ncbi:MAG TPA: hypothetical protein VLI67_05985 [Vicinamibacteria bacterium]|nr:hypothetical protein [Vicinamibacteria bacterium]
MKDFIAHLPPANANLLALLYAHRAYDDGGGGPFDDLIVHPEVPDSELPGGQRFRAHSLATSCLDRGLVGQLNVDGVEQNRPLSGAQGLEMALGFRRVLDPISHESGPLVTSSRRIVTSKVRRGPEGKG